MKAEDAIERWEFNDAITDKSIIRCQKCSKASKLAHWYECTVACSDCGEHGAIGCPECSERFDWVYHHTREFEVVKTKGAK